MSSLVVGLFALAVVFSGASPLVAIGFTVIVLLWYLWEKWK